MVCPQGRLTAFYDAVKCPVTYDFIVFASMAKTVANGRPLHIVFVPRDDGSRSKPGKFTEDEADFRFRHIVLEAVHLFGATFTVCETRDDARAFEAGDIFPLGYTVDSPVFAYQMNDAIDLGIPLIGPRPSAKALRFAEQIITPETVTVTLRTSRHPVRNSSFDDWMKWAEGKPVLFIPDTDTAMLRWPENFCPQAAFNIDLRLALYWKAKMNCFTSNGCGVLLWFTDKPYRWFKAGGDGYMTKQEWDKLKVPYGTQPKFIRPNQKWVWEPDTLEVIEREI